MRWKYEKIATIEVGASLLLVACGGNGSSEANKKEFKFADMMNKGKAVTFKLDNNEEETSTPDKNSPK
ncbi:hypothetical protein QRX48_02740 [Staphylococcus warneri]